MALRDYGRGCRIECAYHQQAKHDRLLRTLTLLSHPATLTVRSEDNARDEGEMGPAAGASSSENRDDGEERKHCRHNENVGGWRRTGGSRTA